MNVRPPIAIPICRDSLFPHHYRHEISRMIQEVLPFLIKVVMRRKHYMEVKMPPRKATLLYLSRECVKDGLSWLSGIFGRKIEIKDFGDLVLETYISELIGIGYDYVQEKELYVSYKLEGRRVMQEVKYVGYKYGYIQFGGDYPNSSIPEDIRDEAAVVDINGARFRWKDVLRALAIGFFGFIEPKYQNKENKEYARRKYKAICAINQALLERTDNILGDMDLPRIKRIVLYEDGRMDVEYESGKNKGVRMCFFSARQAYYSLERLSAWDYDFLVTRVKSGNKYEMVKMILVRPDGGGMVLPYEGDALLVDSIRLSKYGIRIELGGDAWILLWRSNDDRYPYLSFALYFASDKTVKSDEIGIIEFDDGLSSDGLANTLVKKFFPNL